jgi:hypothetical protein
MPVTNEEISRYVDLITEQFRTLECFRLQGYEHVWHYTTGDGLLGIIQSGTIYATQVSCLNDRTEIRYAERLFRQALVDLRRSIVSDTESEFVDTLLRTEENDVTTEESVSDFFVACFSAERDDLSQWRAYGGGEGGYAIAFFTKAFVHPSHFVARVNYDSQVQVDVASALAAATVRFYREGLERRGGDERASWPIHFSIAWAHIIGKLAPMVKDPAFRAEHECRIIHELSPEGIHRLKFRQRQSLLAMHIPLVFLPVDTTRDWPPLPIVEVMVGPSRHKETSRLSTLALLRQKGYTDVPVTVSAVPFQMT